MSSRPLFISVAESIVILPPIVHVGGWRASSTLPPSRSARVRPRKGPPLAVSTSLSIVPGRSAGMIWWSGERDVVVGGGAPGEGASDGGEHELVDRPRPLGRDELVQRRVLRVDGDDL